MASGQNTTELFRQFGALVRSVPGRFQREAEQEKAGFQAQQKTQGKAEDRNFQREKFAFTKETAASKAQTAAKTASEKATSELKTRQATKKLFMSDLGFTEKEAQLRVDAGQTEQDVLSIQKERRLASAGASGTPKGPTASQRVGFVDDIINEELDKGLTNVQSILEARGATFKPGDKDKQGFVTGEALREAATEQAEGSGGFGGFFQVDPDSTALEALNNLDTLFTPETRESISQNLGQFRPSLRLGGPTNVPDPIGEPPVAPSGVQKAFTFQEVQEEIADMREILSTQNLTPEQLAQYEQALKAQGFSPLQIFGIKADLGL